MFGLPGAGKTFAARRLAAHGFHVHDGDDDLPVDMRLAIERAEPVRPEMRDRFIGLLLAHVAVLAERHAKLVVAQTMLKQVHRDRFAARFPQARFVLVTADDDVRRARLAARREQPLEPGSVERMVAAFDPPVFPYATLDNAGSVDDLDRRLAEILTRPGS